MTTYQETAWMPGSWHPWLLCRVALAGLFLWPLACRSAEATDDTLELLLRQPVVAESSYERRLDEIAAAASVVTHDEIRTYGWRMLDEALASLPGFHNSYDRQYHYLGVRGFSVPGDFNTRLLVGINGNRANDVVYDNGPSGRVFPIDLGLVERIEYVPGSAGSVYRQNALFGVINVVTRPGAEVNGTELALSYEDLGQAWHGRATWGRLFANGVDVLLSGSVYEAAGENHFFDFGTAASPAIVRGQDGERDRELFLRLERAPWSFDIAFSNRRKDDPTASYFSDPLVPDQYQRDRYLLSQLQYESALHGGSQQLSARLYFGREKYSGRFVYDGDGFLTTGTSAWQGLEVRWLSNDFERHQLKLGFDTQYESRRDQNDYDFVSAAPVLTIPGKGWRGGVYAEDEWQVFDTVSLTAGLRWDRSGRGTDTWSPRAAMVWKPVPTTIVKALYGHAYREPNSYEHNYDDGFSQIANHGLGGEAIDTLELVLEHRLRPDLWLRGSVYRWLMQDIIVLGIEPISQLTQYQSGDDVNATGIELSMDKTWERGARVRGSLSWQHVTYEQGGRLANSPRLLGKLNASIPLTARGPRAGIELQYTGRRLAIDGSSLSAYWLANLSLVAPTRVRGLELALTVHNLFNEHYQHAGSDSNWQNAIDQDGRSLRLHAQWRF